MLELSGMQSTLSLPSLPGPLWPGVVAPDIGPIYVVVVVAAVIVVVVVVARRPFGWGCRIHRLLLC